MKKTIYEHWFSSVEKTARFISETCCFDCLACPFSSFQIGGIEIPCFQSYKYDKHDINEIMDWLKSEYR